MARYAPNTPGGALEGYLDLGLEEQTDPTEGMAPWELFDYLLKPRRHQQEVQLRGGSYYGPSREATVSPEDLLRATKLLEMMHSKEKRSEESMQAGQLAEGRDIELGRARAADQLLKGRQPQPQQTMSMGGRTETWGGQPVVARDFTQDDLLTLAAGGVGGAPAGRTGGTGGQGGGGEGRNIGEMQKVLDTLLTQRDNMANRGEDTSKIDAQIDWAMSQMGYGAAPAGPAPPGGPKPDPAPAPAGPLTKGQQWQAGLPGGQLPDRRGAPYSPGLSAARGEEPKEPSGPQISAPVRMPPSQGAQTSNSMFAAPDTEWLGETPIGPIVDKVGGWREGQIAETQGVDSEGIRIYPGHPLWERLPPEMQAYNMQWWEQNRGGQQQVADAVGYQTEYSG